ncbi:MAG: hypothetical protein Q4G22_13970 [Paracoccus sp. (in: a-proteobacteria)]|uniref:hypothetical protein n=1 Tax=Paracoccus sp. TaxID=267 RepID=UPI0026E08E7C|nr:hypothetical protein [Paracoccus sp. (in: a-proteobacteria)]MDO5632925.1 hypothetical protein [Paracoccus sp. (in: a-proteobacteria)]
MRIALIAFSLLLAACTNSPEYQAAARMTDNPTQVRAFLSDTTVRSYSGPHGTQIEYLAADGRSHLLYPGNARIVPGEWQIRGSGEINAEMCFRYGPNTYNPATGSHGSNWECGFLTDYLMYRDEIIDGDVLRLAGRTVVPAPLPKRQNLTIGQVQSMWGLPVTNGPNKSLGSR